MKTRGYTLMEVLVAVAILALLTTVTWASMTNSFHAKETVEASMDRYLGARLALERLARELGSAWIAPAPLAIETRTFATDFRLSDEGGSSRLDFVSFSHTRLVKDANESDQSELSYWVAEDKEARGTLALWRREAPVIDERSDVGGKAAVVVTDVVRFAAEALDPTSSEEGEWVEAWDTTQATSHPNRLPRAVRLTLVFHDERGEEVTFTTVARIFLETPVCGVPGVETVRGDEAPTGLLPPAPTVPGRP